MIFSVIIPIAMFDLFENYDILGWAFEFEDQDDYVNKHMRFQIQQLQHDSFNSLRVMGSVTVFFGFYLLKLISLPILRALSSKWY